MIDHARHCTGYPCTCRAVIAKRPDAAHRTFTCSVCKGEMAREGRGFVHTENGLTICPDQGDELWE